MLFAGAKGEGRGSSQKSKNITQGLKRAVDRDTSLDGPPREARGWQRGKPVPKKVVGTSELLKNTQSKHQGDVSISEDGAVLSSHHNRCQRAKRGKT